jgi:hypothetical protein
MRNAIAPTLLSLLVAGGLTACASNSALADSHSGPHCPASAGPCAHHGCSPATVAPRVEAVDESGARLPTYLKDGRAFVLGEVGGRYLLHVVNPTPGRVEAVVSVDGLDVIDGHPASTSRRGYLVPAFGDVTIDGWRTSLSSVAAFRFSSVHDSYAGRTGHDRNVGVIGVAFFRERVPPPPRPLPKLAQGEPASAPAAAASRAAANDARASGAAGAVPAPRAPGAAADAERAGLGTEFGEAHTSEVEEAPFVRGESTPCTVAQLWYDDRAGLLARGIELSPRDPRVDENQLRDTAQPFAERFAQPPP